MNWIIIDNHRLHVDRIVDYNDTGYSVQVWYARTAEIVIELEFQNVNRSKVMYQLDVAKGIRKKVERKK